MVNQRNVRIVWGLILFGLLVSASLVFAVYFAAARLSFEQAQQLVNSMAADKQVDFFSPDVFSQLLGLLLALGIGLILIALVWALTYKRSLVWVSSSWTQITSRLAADRAQILAVHKSGSLVKRVYLLIPAAFWIGYSWIGISLRQSALFRRYNMIFDADFNLVFPALTQWGGESERHPLISLFFSPFGSPLARLLNSPEAAAVVLSGFAGSLTVWLVLLILARLGLKPLTAALWACVLGLSTSQIVFASLPETYIFGASSLALAFYLMLTFPGNLLLFIPAGIYTFGITITNLIPVAITYLLSLTGMGFPRRESFRRIFIFSISVVLLAALLNIVTVAVTRRGTLFFLPEVYKRDLQYTYSGDDTSLPSRAGLLAESFFLYNIAGPNLYLAPLDRHDEPTQIPTLPAGTVDSFDNSNFNFASYVPSSLKQASIAAYFAWMIWLGLTVLGLAGIIRQRLYRTPFFWAVVACLLFNFVAHLFYGLDVFLFTPHWTLLIIIFVAHGIGNIKHERMIQISLVALMLLLAWNNAILISRLGAIFSG